MKNQDGQYRTTIAALLVAIACSFGPAPAYTQNQSAEAPRPLIIPTVFAQREAKASPAIKAKLAALRRQKEAKKWTFEVVYTAALDRDLKAITGARIPANLAQEVKAQNAKAAILLREFHNKPKANNIGGVTMPSFDWRQHNGVTPVRDQGGCGSCWDFAAHGALEGSYLINDGLTIDSSEQNSLDCNTVGDDCGGGWPSGAFEYMEKTGSAKETDYPYMAVRSNCRTPNQPYRVLTWGYVGDDDGVPSVEKLKEALLYYGPLAVCVNATAAFQSYGGVGAVFNEFADGDINHCVTLIGWDDAKQAWLIKNSWGTLWGDTCGFGQEHGYMWIKYGCNKIGYGAEWVVVQPASVVTAPDTLTWSITPVVNTAGPIIYDGDHFAPQISIQPGDVIEVTAGGCVQTGGHGKTWKRYVNPSGPGSDKLYFGSINIPGRTQGLTPIRNLSGAYNPQSPDEYTVAFPNPVRTGIPVNQSYLELSYMDDGYSDNGYYAHDDGTEDQCKGLGQAHVQVTIHRALKP
jgi:C1A family cysteine protease